MRTPPRDGRNPAISLISAFKLLLPSGGIDQGEELDYVRKILSLCGGVFSSDQAANAFLYLCRKGAVTSWLLQVHLDMPETTSYRVLRRLRALGLVEPVLKLPKIRMGRKGGSVPTVWGLVGNYSSEEVAQAIVLHYRSLSPKYRAAEKVAQTILNDYIRRRNVSEIPYREIVIQVKKLRIPFKGSDIADLAAQYLHERGVRVWR